MSENERRGHIDAVVAALEAHARAGLGPIQRCEIVGMLGLADLSPEEALLVIQTGILCGQIIALGDYLFAAAGHSAARPRAPRA